MQNRPFQSELARQMAEPRYFMQIVAGPRQVGKTTACMAVAREMGEAARYVSADDPGLKDGAWLRQAWEVSRARAASLTGGAALFIDEIQKIHDWSATVKALWDEDTRNRVPLKICLTGSSRLLMEKGLGESLAGRFELIAAPHWSYSEMKKTFGWDWRQYAYFGAYPGAAPLADDEDRWRNYIRHSLIETVLSHDVLQLNPVQKPALLRRLFQFACAYSGQTVSYTKMTGQLQDAGNTTTLAHYLDLLEAAGLVCGLQKFSHETIRQRASRPKLQVLNTALMGAQSPLSFKEAQENPADWGRFVESAAGAHLKSTATGTRVKVCYWQEGQAELDFVLTDGRKICAIEVKSGTHAQRHAGLDAFLKRYPQAKPILVGPGGIEIEAFLARPAVEWLG